MAQVTFLDVLAPAQELAAELQAASVRVMNSGWYIGGVEVEAFESEFAAACGTRHCVGVGNGLDALVLILRAYGIGLGDEVIVPANTYIATWLAISHAGAIPVPVEPHRDTMNLDAGCIAAGITPRTRAIMAVHLYGQPAEMDKIRQVASERGLRLIHDAAQAHGARYNDQPIGQTGDAAAFSFYPTKNLGAYGDGGAVVTDDDAVADRVRLLRNYGSRTKYYNEIKGFNSRLDPIQAAFLRVKLKHLDAWNARRRDRADQYKAQLAGIPDLRLPAVAAGADPAWHLFVVCHPRRDALKRSLADAGIETLVHYPVPPHLSDAYADGGWKVGDFPITEEIANTALSLPIGPHLPSESVDLVIEAVRRFCA